MITHLLYVSEESKNYRGDQDLKDILEKSKKNNLSRNITGLLIKNDRFFIQVLEGPKGPLRDVYNNILSDPRHQKAKELLEYTDKERIFPNWQMGFVASNPKNQMKIQKLVPMLHEDTLNIPEKRDKLLAILKNFNKELE